VGPEGGWAPDEIRALEDFSTTVTLGSRTLRADAAAVVALAALFAVWGVDE
jgi:RsmE family RNA methyltransferase